jgi:enolase
VLIGLDCAASELYRDGRYHLAGESLQLSSHELVDYLANLADRFPIVSIEDGMAETTGMAGKCSPVALAKVCRSSATMSS